MDAETICSRERVTVEEGQFVALNHGLYRVKEFRPISHTAAVERIFPAEWIMFAPVFRTPQGWILKPHPERPIVVLPYDNASDCVKCINQILKKYEVMEEELVLRARALKREKIQELCQLGRVGKL